MWSCPRCTLENEDRSNQCQACLGPKSVSMPVIPEEMLVDPLDPMLLTDPDMNNMNYPPSSTYPGLSTASSAPGLLNSQQAGSSSPFSNGNNTALGPGTPGGENNVTPQRFVKGKFQPRFTGTCTDDRTSSDEEEDIYSPSAESAPSQPEGQGSSPPLLAGGTPVGSSSFFTSDQTPKQNLPPEPPERMESLCPEDDRGLDLGFVQNHFGEPGGFCFNHLFLINFRVKDTDENE